MKQEFDTLFIIVRVASLHSTSTPNINTCASVQRLLLVGSLLRVEVHSGNR